MSYQIIQMTNGKKIKFSHAAINHLAGNAASTEEENGIIRNWYERNAEAKLLATYARGKDDVIGISEVEYTERNVFAGERIYTIKNHKEKVMVDNRLIDVFDAMTRKVAGGTAYLRSDGSVWFVMGKDGTGTTPEASSAEIAPTQKDTAEPIELPTQENDATAAEFDHDEKSGDLDHQLALGNEFLFSIDGVGGAPTTAVIARLRDGLYRADISADQNGNYKAGAILFLGEQVDAVYYHAVIVSAEVINNRQVVADWIKKNGVDKADLSGADFSGCDLGGVRLSECDLSEADFGGCDLDNSKIILCKSIETNFSGANLSWSQLNGTDFSLSKFVGAKLVGSDIEKADLSYADLSSADLSSVDLTGAKLDHSKLIGARLIRANLSGATIDHAVIEGANFSNANLFGAKIKSARVRDAAANFTNANFKEAELNSCSLNNFNLDWATLDDCKIVDCTASPEQFFMVLTMFRPSIKGLKFVKHALAVTDEGHFFAVDNNGGDRVYFLSYTNGLSIRVTTADRHYHPQIWETTIKLDLLLGDK